MGCWLSLNIGWLGAQESADTMQSTAEMAIEQPPGAWQGNWLLRREHADLHTLGGSELLRLHILHDTNDETLSVQWVAGRAVCPETNASPCEWVSAAGETTGWIGPTGLYAVLSISADAEDPFVLHLGPDSHGARGVLFSGKGGVRYSLVYERLDDDSSRGHP